MRVDQSANYEDVETQKQREGDVLAVYHWQTPSLAVAIEVTVECKAGKASPWVAFYDDRRFISDNHQLWFSTAGVWPSDDLRQAVSAWRTSDLVTDRVATHVVSAFGKDSNNHAQDAVQQAFSFARARLKHGTTRYVDVPREIETVNAVVPLVVTQAPLFSCELTVDGEVLLEPVDGFDVWVQLDRNRGRRRVYVRSEAKAEGFAQTLQGIATELSDSSES